MRTTRGKRLLASILVLLMLVGTLPMQAFAAVNEDFAVNLTVEEDGTFEGRSVYTVSFQVKTTGDAQIAQQQTVVLTFDATTFDLLNQTMNDRILTLSNSELEFKKAAVDLTLGAGWQADQTMARLSEDSETGYLVWSNYLTVDPDSGIEALKTDGKFVTIATVKLVLKEGKEFAANSFGLIDEDEMYFVNQNAIAWVADGTNTYIYGHDTGDDTLAEPEIEYTNFTPVKSSYTGTEAAAPTVERKQGGNVTLAAQTIEGEQVEYGYSTRQGVEPSDWQDKASFTGVPAGTVYFWARVKENLDHMAGQAAASQAVTIYAAPAISYDAIPDMTVDTAIADLAPTVENEGAGAAEAPYQITKGSLPAGLTLDAATGVISGTPTAAGKAGQVTVTYTDIEGQTADAVVKYGAVNKLSGQLVISCADVAYGSQPAPKVIENVSGGKVTYVYSTDANGKFGPWDTKNPVGTYYVKGIAAATDQYGETESNVVAFKVMAGAISGSVTIAGTPAYGQTLTAKPSGIPGTPAYQWYRDGVAIDGANQATYKLTLADVGCAISVKVSDKNGNYAGTVDSAATAAVSKAAYTGKVTGKATVVSSAYDKGPATDYAYDLSSLSGLPADLEGVGYGAVALSVNGDGLIAAQPAPAVKEGKLTYTVSPKEEGKSAVITVVLTSANYQDITASITVTSVDKQPADIGLKDVTVTYDGQGHEVSPVWPEVGTGSAVKTVTYTKDGVSVSQPKDAGTYTVSAVYENDTHYGTASATLTIRPLEAKLAWSGDTGLVYDGAAKNVTASVSNLVEGDKCAVTVEGGDKINAGSYTAKAVSLDNPNYALPADATHKYTIDPRAVDLSVTLEPAEFEFNNAVQAPTTFTVKDGDKTLTADTDYTVSIPADTTAVGTYTVTVTGAGNYAGSKGSADYAITKVSQAALTIEPTGNKTYGDAPFTITVGGGSGEGAYSLTSSDPAILSLEQGETAGTWTATVRKAGTVTLTAGKGEDDNYKPAQLTVQLTVDPKALAEDAASLPQDYAPIYSGSGIEPVVTVKDGETVLVKDVDYTVTYADNINVGQATVTVAGTGNYTGTITMHFAISPKSLTSQDVALSGLPERVTYTGQAVAPQITVKDGQMVLVQDTDYTVIYADNTGVGTATVTVTGKGNYKDSAQATFEIAAAAATGVVAISGADFNVGTELTASVSGKTGDLAYQWYRNGAPIEDAAADKYTLTEDDADAQIAVKVTSTGSYVGTLESAPITVGKTALTGTLTLTNAEGVVTAAVEGAPEDGYDIVWLRDGQPVSGATGTTYTITDADQGHTVSAKLTAKGDYTGEIIGTGAVEVAAAAPGQPVLTTSVGDGRITVSWTAADNGDPIYQYQVQLDDQPVITVNNTVSSYTFTGLNNDQTYTVKVTAINAQGNTTASAEATPKGSSGGGGGGGGSSAAVQYTITVKQSEGGKIAPETVKVEKGEDQSFTITADQGYAIKDVLVDGKSVGAVSTYTFENVTRAHTIQAVFEEAPFQFSDLEDDHWAAPYIYDLYQRGIVNGVGGDLFAPSRTITRAEFVKMLAGVAGVTEEDLSDQHSAFADVEQGSWYEPYVVWATENGVTTGTSATTFAPMATISREQMATMIYRYAQSAGIDLPESQPAVTFADADSFADWAAQPIEAMQRAGIINGVGGNRFAPQDLASRAEACKMLSVLLDIAEA